MPLIYVLENLERVGLHLHPNVPYHLIREPCTPVSHSPLTNMDSYVYAP